MKGVRPGDALRLKPSGHVHKVEGFCRYFYSGQLVQLACGLARGRAALTRDYPLNATRCPRCYPPVDGDLAPRPFDAVDTNPGATPAPVSTPTRESTA